MLRSRNSQFVSVVRLHAPRWKMTSGATAFKFVTSAVGAAADGFALGKVGGGLEQLSATTTGAGWPQSGHTNAATINSRFSP